MKKLIILLVSVGALALLGWYAIGLMDNQGKSDTELIEFAIKDIETIDKVIITDGFSRKFELIKTNGEWADKNGGCVVQESVDFVLDAIKNIEFKGYLTDNSHKKFTNIMSGQHTKVEIFQNEAWTKTWYIGPASKDHMGQIMLLDSEEFGKSDIPVLMKIKGVHGIIEPRFFADARKWMCTDVFTLGLNEIQKVDVKFNDEPSRSFTVTKKGTDMKVYQQGKQLPAVDTAMIFRYLNNYKKIHYDLANYELTQDQVDSLTSTTPFCELTVTENIQRKTKLRMFRINNTASVNAGIAEIEDIDQNKFWCQLPNGEMVKCQYFVFNPLLLGHVYFPLDLTGLKTHNGIVPVE